MATPSASDDDYKGWNGISVDYVTFANNKRLEIARFHSYQAYIDDLYVDTLHTATPMPTGIPAGQNATALFNSYGPVPAPVAGVPVNLATLTLTEGVWLLHVLVSGLVVGSPADSIQWRACVSAAVSPAGVVTVQPVAATDVFTHGLFSAPPGNATTLTPVAALGPFQLHLQIQSGLANARFTGYVQGVCCPSTV